MRARRLGQVGVDYRRRICTSRESRQAVPALALQPPSSKTGGGFFSWLLGKKNAASSVNVPPMYEPLAGVNLPPPLADRPEPVETKITKLANGMTIASENTVGPTTTIGLYVDSGSIHENSYNSGVTHLLERMAFKSTLNRTHMRLVREVEAIGGNIVASASREQMSYTGDVIRSYMPEVVELITDSVRNPVFHDWEIKEQLAILKNEIAELKNNPESLLLEALHPACYTGALAKPLLASESALEKLVDSRFLREFVAENFTASRMVLAGSGVDHEELLSISRPLFEDMPLVKPPPAPESQYIGGDWRVQAESETTHVAVAFEVPGGWRNERDAIAATVLQSLLGGGGSFSAGGPGKGVHSRLYTRVLSHYGKVESFTAFSSVYNDSGLFGIHASSVPEFVPQLVNLITNELLEVAAPGEVTEMELERAKNATISLVLMNLESRVVVTEDIGRQILTYGCRKPAKEFIDSVHALTLDDICEIADKIISTPVAMACRGDVSKVPRLEEVSSRFQQTD